MEVLATREIDLIVPYGGKLVNLMVEGEERSRLVEHAYTLPSVQLTSRSVCDVELLSTSAFSPLDGFMAGPSMIASSKRTDRLCQEQTANSPQRPQHG